MKRSTIGKVLPLLLAFGAATFAFAQEYPSRPVQILVGFVAGGGVDIAARVIAQPLSKILGQPVIVQNRPGAGGQVAASALLREGVDGLAILALNYPDLYLTVELNKAPYKASDFQIIMVDVKDPRVMLVSKSSNIGSLHEFVARANAQPQKLSASVAQGTAQELFAKWLFKSLRLDVIVVGYKGGGDAANAVLSGEVTANIGDDVARLNFRDRMNALFVGSKESSPRWPEAPTLHAALAPFGVTPPSADFMARYGVYVVAASFKSKHPADYRTLQAAMLQAYASPQSQAYIERSGLKDLSIGKPGEDFDAAFAADMVQVKKLIE